MADISENTPLDAASALSLGKRHLLVRDYHNAVITLVQACELLAKDHGDGADELAEPYLLYGRALLGLAREESNVLGAGVPGTKDSDEEEDIEDDEEGDEEEKSEKDAKEEKSDTADEEEKSDVTDKEEKKDADKEEKKESAAKEEKKDSAAKEEKKDLAEKEEKKDSAEKEEKKDSAKREEKKDSADKEEKKDVDNKAADTSCEKKDPETKQSEGENKTVDQEKEKSSDDSTPKVEDNKSEAKEENTNEVTNSSDQKETEKNEKSEIAKDEAVPGSSKMTNGESSAALNGSVAENGEEDEDVDNLEVAWEVLELAKLMLLKRGQAGWKFLAEAHKLLGEVAMEGGNANGATTDFQACLDLLQKIEPCEPRAIAEIYYQLGLSFSYMNDFDTSIEKFQEASSILEARIKELEQTTEAPKSDDPFYSTEGEIKELRELLPEIAEKISDMKDAKQEACKRLIEDIRERAAAGSCSNGASTSAVNGGASSSGTSSGSSAGPFSASSSGPSSGSSSGLSKKSVNDISHLIRKKRKPEEALAEESSPCKKVSPQ